MRVPRVQFRVRRLMALVAGVAFLMPIGMWVRDMWWRRVYLLDGAAIVAVNERTARKLLSLPNVAPLVRALERVCRPLHPGAAAPRAGRRHALARSWSRPAVAEATTSCASIESSIRIVNGSLWGEKDRSKRQQCKPSRYRAERTTGI